MSVFLTLQSLIHQYNHFRIDSLEKFRERIPFMRSELKDERMYDNTNTQIIDSKFELAILVIFNLSMKYL